MFDRILSNILDGTEKYSLCFPYNTVLVHLARLYQLHARKSSPTTGRGSPKGFG